MVEDLAWRCSYIGADFTWALAAGVSVQDAWARLPASGLLYLVLYKGEWDGAIVTPDRSESGVQRRQFVVGTDWYGLSPEGGYVQGMGDDAPGAAALEARYPGCRPKEGKTASQLEWSRVRALLESNHDIPAGTSLALIP